MMKAEFTINKRVYYHDTDCGGVVYYANYLKFFEEARTEHLRSKGIDLRKLGKEGILFAVAGLDIKYKGPARYGDELIVTSKIEEAKATTLYFYQEVRRDRASLAECRTRLVAIDLSFKPVAVPFHISKLLAGLT